MNKLIIAILLIVCILVAQGYTTLSKFTISNCEREMRALCIKSQSNYNNRFQERIRNQHQVKSLGKKLSQALAHVKSIQAELRIVWERASSEDIIELRDSMDSVRYKSAIKTSKLPFDHIYT